MKERYRQLILTQGERFLRDLEARIGQASLIGNKPFFDPGLFSWSEDLEANWQVIRQELDVLLEKVTALPNFQDISRDQYSITQDNLWKTYFLYVYGFKAEKNCQKCPETTRLVEQIPGMKTAFFSILLPHKHIPEHRGPYKGVLRYHLALKVPEPAIDCGIRVGEEIRHWEEGKSLVFDDTFPHEAWNKTDNIRVVLFVDFVRPLRFPAAMFNQWMIQLLARSPYVQGEKENFLEWERRVDEALRS